LSVSREFAKYKARGAYHWEAFNRSVRKHSPFLAGRYELVVKTLQRTVRPGGRVLDIGCGDGALAYAITRAGYKVIGLDYSGTGLGLAKRKFSEMRVSAGLMRGDSTVLPVRDLTFDAIVAADIIEHLQEPEKMLEEISRALKPGGTAVITTPVKLTETPTDPEHVREFTEPEFKETLDRHFGGVDVTLSHPKGVMERYERRYRLLGIFGRVRPYRYWYNFLSSYMGNNPFMDFTSGEPTLMTAGCIKVNK